MPTVAVLAKHEAYTRASLARGLPFDHAAASAWLGITLDWFSAKTLAYDLTDEQVQMYRALPEWQQHEQHCGNLVDAGASTTSMQAACKAWMQRAAQHMFNTVPVEGV